MTARVPAVLLLAGLLTSPVAASASQDAGALRAHGLELSFNLDYPEALAVFRDSIKADPDNLAGYRMVTAALWADALFRHGAISADDFTGESRTPFRSRQATVELENAATELRRRVEVLSQATRRRDSIGDVETSYQIGAAYRLLAALAGSIGGSQLRVSRT